MSRPTLTRPLVRAGAPLAALATVALVAAPGERPRLRHPVGDRRRVVHRAHDERPARLRRLADHEGRDPGAGVGALGHADPQPVLRPRGEHPGARRAGHRRPRQRGHRAHREHRLHLERPVARGPARHLRADLPGARHGRRDARLPDHPDLREGRDRLGRGALRGPGPRGAGAPGPLVRGDRGHCGGRPTRRSRPPTRRRPTRARRRRPTTPRRRRPSSPACWAGPGWSSARSACWPAARRSRGAGSPRDPTAAAGVAAAGGPARRCRPRRARARCSPAPHRPRRTRS